MIAKLICLLFLAVLVGCGQARTSAVEGVVLLDGQPLANASIQLIPNGSGRDATATTNARGEFSMSTFDPHDGAVPGSYKVVISPPLGAVDSTKYESAGEAMSAAVRTKPAAKTTFPKKYTSPSETPLTLEVPVGKEKLKFELSSQ